MSIQHPRLNFDTRDQLDGFAVNRISKMLGGQTCSLFMSGVARQAQYMKDFQRLT